MNADLLSLLGLKSLGPFLRSLRDSWRERLDRGNTPSFPLPRGRMLPLGYVVVQQFMLPLQHVPVPNRWLSSLPGAYAQSILDRPGGAPIPSSDPNCLAMLKPYRSLIPMAQESRKPIFALTPADGAIGSHAQAVRDAYKDYYGLAQKILKGVTAAQSSAEAEDSCL